MADRLGDLGHLLALADGVEARRLLTDNGTCYRSRAFGSAVAGNGLRHLARGPAGRRPTAKPRPS
jgi:transposase InsO family protein